MSSNCKTNKDIFQRIISPKFWKLLVQQKVVKADLQMILHSGCFAGICHRALFQDYKLKPLESCTALPFDPGQLLFGRIRKSPTLFEPPFARAKNYSNGDVTQWLLQENFESLIQNNDLWFSSKHTLQTKMYNLHRCEFDLGKGVRRLESTETCLIQKRILIL